MMTFYDHCKRIATDFAGGYPSIREIHALLKVYLLQCLKSTPRIFSNSIEVVHDMSPIRQIYCAIFGRLNEPGR